ncbi:hypothetical protein BDZ45DRAFT_401172 [Acephala macrosclerotiorum]|nr:hypothetical protein BDZ45DRAFT_401172 [Acephala macrosclerotiorum]
MGWHGTAWHERKCGCLCASTPGARSLSNAWHSKTNGDTRPRPLSTTPIISGRRHRPLSCPAPRRKPSSDRARLSPRRGDRDGYLIVTRSWPTR